MSVAETGRMPVRALLRLTPILAILAFLCACAERTPPAGAESDAASAVDSSEFAGAAPLALPFTAGGNEPGWRLDISTDSLRLTWNYGQDRISTSVPEYTRTEEGHQYRADTELGMLVVAVYDEICVDDMSGMPHPSRVSVDIDNRTLSGCGGPPESLLTGESWNIESLGDEPVLDEVTMTVQFTADGRLTGSSGCNSYATSYALSGEGLRLGTIASTRKACRPAVMDQERRFEALLQTVSTFEIQPDGALVLRAAAGGSIRASR